MNARLLQGCAVLWALGLFGVVLARSILALDPSAWAVQVPVGLWILGGAGYVGLGLSALMAAYAATRRGRKESNALSVRNPFLHER